MWLETDLWCKNCIRKPQVWELSRLCSETSTKFYVHEFGFCKCWYWHIDELCYLFTETVIVNIDFALAGKLWQTIPYKKPGTLVILCIWVLLSYAYVCLSYTIQRLSFLRQSRHAPCSHNCLRTGGPEVAAAEAVQVLVWVGGGMKCTFSFVPLTTSPPPLSGGTKWICTEQFIKSIKYASGT